MGAINPHAQTLQEKVRLRAIWEARPEVRQMSRQVQSQIDAEGLTFSAEGLTRTFALIREWQDAHGVLPESGIRAEG